MTEGWGEISFGSKCLLLHKHEDLPLLPRIHTKNFKKQSMAYHWGVLASQPSCIIELQATENTPTMIVKQIAS